jgi:hypothetical protein
MPPRGSHPTTRRPSGQSRPPPPADACGEATSALPAGMA